MLQAESLVLKVGNCKTGRKSSATNLDHIFFKITDYWKVAHSVSNNINHYTYQLRGFLNYLVSMMKKHHPLFCNLKHKYHQNFAWRNWKRVKREAVLLQFSINTLYPVWCYRMLLLRGLAIEGLGEFLTLNFNTNVSYSTYNSQNWTIL